MVHFDEIPKVMVDAVLSAEDEHFFQHAGFDPLGHHRARSSWISRIGKMQGSSTLTHATGAHACAGGRRAGWRRKIPEFLITLHLEKNLTKKQIFEYYANTIYLGNQGSFSINGFGEGRAGLFRQGPEPGDPAGGGLLAGLIQSQDGGTFPPSRSGQSAPQHGAQEHAREQLDLPKRNMKRPPLRRST